MQACGALFVKTETAMEFIAITLADIRDTIVSEFVSVDSISLMFFHLLMTLRLPVQ